MTLPDATDQHTGQITGLFASRGGVPKLPILADTVSLRGLSLDKVKHTKIHGGPDRALCLFSADLVEALRREGHPIAPGWIGENVLLRGMDWQALEIGSVLQLGASVQVQVTDYTEPCNQIASAFLARDFRRIKQSLHPGWSRLYVRVLAGGEIKEGDPAVQM